MGVYLEPIYMGGGMNSLAAVTSNTVEFLSAASTATISAHSGGIDIVMFDCSNDKLDHPRFCRTRNQVAPGPQRENRHRNSSGRVGGQRVAAVPAQAGWCRIKMPLLYCRGG